MANILRQKGHYITVDCETKGLATMELVGKKLYRLEGQSKSVCCINDATLVGR